MNINLKLKVINFLKAHPSILNMVAFCYSVANGSNIYKYLFNKNIQVKGAFLKNVKIKSSKNARIIIGPRCQLKKCIIRIYGSESSLHINGKHTCINSTSFTISGGVVINEDVSIQQASINCGHNSCISIGSHCMFSGDIEIDTGDGHPIFSTETNKRINFDKDIVISDHVWLAAHVRVMKGSYIAPHTIIGKNSLVSGKLTEHHSIYAGCPAKFIKSGIYWTRN